MSAPLPTALRRRFQSYILEGHTGRGAARLLKLSPATGVRWAKKEKVHGQVKPAIQGRPKGTGKLSPHLDFIKTLVEQDGDITLSQIRSALLEAEGVSASLSSLSDALKRLGYSYKKNRWWPPSVDA